MLGSNKKINLTQRESSFSAMTSLRLVDFSAIPELTFSSNAFDTQSNTAFFNVRGGGNTLPHIPADLFRQTGGSPLILRNMGINRVDDGAFTDIVGAGIDLRGNDIEYLSPRAFPAYLPLFRHLY